MRNFLILFLITFSLISSALAELDLSKAIRFKVEKYQLNNGLTVILHEDHSVPQIAYHTWFRVGSKHEEKGYTGLAHLFEHMMFRGTEKVPGKEFDRMLAANGIDNNAFTSNDYTGYYENLPSDQLELVMRLESDRMVNLKVDAENLQSEREVVKEERRMRVDNSVGGVLYENLMATIYQHSAYHWPVIGWMKDLDRLSLEKCREFYTKNYAPNNAVLVIVGSFSTAKVKKMIEKYYGALPSSKLERSALPQEPAQTAARVKNIVKDVQSVQFILAYRGPGGLDTEVYALDLLAAVLGQGDSSRLHQAAVYQNPWATSASSYYNSQQDSGHFTVSLSLRPGISFEQVKPSIFKLVYQLKDHLIPLSEVQKAKNSIMYDYVDALKTISGKARTLASSEVLYGDYSVFFRDLESYQKVTPDQLREVAKKYLHPEKASTVIVEPQKQR